MPIVAGDYTAGTADGEQAGLPLPIEMIPTPLIPNVESSAQKEAVRSDDAEAGGGMRDTTPTTSVKHTIKERKALWL